MVALNQHRWQQKKRKEKKCLQNMTWATFWAIFSQIHLITLQGTNAIEHWTL
jgi:hypothetical protein